MKRGNCRDCGKINARKSGLCPRCHLKNTAHESLNQLEDEFKPKTATNEFIFKKYLESLRARWVTYADAVVAAKLAEYLEQHSVDYLTSWKDVVRVSAQVGIHYKTELRGCPILQVGRALEAEGLIVPLVSSKVIERSHSFNRMAEPIKSLARDYFENVAGNLAADGTLDAINMISRWLQFLGTTPALEAGQEDAIRFIATFPTGSAVRTGEIAYRLKRFCDWLVENNHMQRNPFSEVSIPRSRRLCTSCQRVKVFVTASEICPQCRTDSRSRGELKVIAADGKNLPEYSRDLFELYIKYLHRYKMERRYIITAKQFLCFLQQKTDLSILQSWPDVATLSRESKSFSLFHGGKRMWGGCPVKKIGRVLQELGVLPICEEAWGGDTERILKTFSPVFASVVREYLAFLKIKRRTGKLLMRVTETIKNFDDWLKLQKNPDIWLASEKMAEEYLLTIASPNNRYLIKLQIAKFYNWAKLERYTLLNPFASIKVRAASRRLKVCSPEQVKKLRAFIRSPKSDPELAIILALVFYWGLNCRDLTAATIEFENQQIKLILHRQPLSYGNKKYRRDQTQLLPAEPAWLRDLQKRFYKSWEEEFRGINANFPRRPLIVLKRQKHNRPVTTFTVRKLFYRATSEATGVRIPPNVVRRSGADLYSQQGATAILQRQGWSAAHAFKFTWLPREFI